MPTTLLLLDRALRTDDNPTLNAALHAGQPVIALVDARPRPPWLADRLPTIAASRPATRARERAWHALSLDLASHGIGLWRLGEGAAQRWTQLIDHSRADRLFVPAHTDPDQTRMLAKLPLEVVTVGDNHLLSTDQHKTLPAKLQGRFTPFFHAVKHWPVQTPEMLQDCPQQKAVQLPDFAEPVSTEAEDGHPLTLPITRAEVNDWLERYLWQQQAVLHYKATRNDLMGDVSSSRLSAALALGTLSVRRLFEHLHRFERTVQGNTSTAALRYEWYWREYFQWLGGRLGDALYQAPVPELTDTQQDRLHRWCTANSGVPIVDAAMTELQKTGFLSNRARQLAASCLVHDLGVPWQYGAAWFEHHLIDFDPNSNTGNWAYIAGDNAVSPKPHAFDLVWQSQRYDPDEQYRRYWLGQ